MQHDQPLKKNGIMSLTGNLEDPHVKQNKPDSGREVSHFYSWRGIDKRCKLFGVPKGKRGQERVRYG